MSLLTLNNVSKNFGGLKALSDVSIDVEEGKITGIIGPNGSGKTTLFNVITGFMKPNGGDIIFDGKSILNLKPHEISNRGLGRTFQIVKIFGNLTVVENVMIGALHYTSHLAEARKEACRVLDFLNLSELSDVYGDALTISSRKQVEMARALTLKPKLLLLDEPGGGMNPTEVDELMGQLSKIKKSGITIVVIEHIMKAIMGVSDRIVAINYGKVIAKGTPKEVSMNEEVISAYLGDTVNVL
ncbi:ABC-type branched-chain amino acid transport system, ATPase component [uncultured Spirochaetota bacterium]|jgi:branched-chain amino acid transport system ATP-binding protein|nr:ABC-type branched-chain amino acid transport system, ATPase component [uncultured Spirochaetota bacterium]